MLVRHATTEEQTLKADPFAQLKLLDVQELDSRLDQLRHRLETLPETAQLAELSSRRTDVDNRARDARIRVEDLTREQKKADADVEQVRSRRTRDQQRLDQGLVSSPKDLKNMQHELSSLERRISSLEDTELEVMEQLESAQRELDELSSATGELDARIGDLTAARDGKAVQLHEEQEEAVAERDRTAADVPDDLMQLYGKLRGQKGGVGAAALRARRCGGCSLELNPADRGVIAKAPSDDVLRCEECGRILVRTSESGV